MKKNLNKNSLIRYSRQIILKNIGTIGQKKILNSKVLIVGAGGLGCPAADLLTRSGVGEIGIIDYDKVNLSNIHRQTLYTTKDVNKYKVDKGEITFLSANTWDVSGAGNYGYNSIWVNRNNNIFDKLDYKPKNEVKNLEQLLDLK